MSTRRPPAPEPDRSECTACRGTGALISGKGDRPHPVSCPWCEGSGRFEPGHDAQRHVAEPDRHDAEPDLHAAES